MKELHKPTRNSYRSKQESTGEKRQNGKDSMKAEYALIERSTEVLSVQDAVAALGNPLYLL